MVNRLEERGRDLEILEFYLSFLSYYLYCLFFYDLRNLILLWKKKYIE